MNKNTGIVVGIVALVLIVGGVYASMRDTNERMMATEKTPAEIEEQTTPTAEDTKMTKETVSMEQTTMMPEKVVEKEVMMKTGSYEAYGADKIARAATGDVVLFFHASWCPSCRGLSSNIESNLTAIPEGVTILKTDYDTETDLKKKYGVTYQHTLVQVDKDGNMIKKWTGSPSLEKLVAQIQ